MSVNSQLLTREAKKMIINNVAILDGINNFAGEIEVEGSVGELQVLTF
jgi:hypothetical protein